MLDIENCNYNPSAPWILLEPSWSKYNSYFWSTYPRVCL